MDLLMDGAHIGFVGSAKWHFAGICHADESHRVDGMRGIADKEEAGRIRSIAAVKNYLWHATAHVKGVKALKRMLFLPGFDDPRTPEVDDADLAALEKEVGGHFLRGAFQDQREGQRHGGAYDRAIDFPIGQIDRAGNKK